MLPGGFHEVYMLLRQGVHEFDSDAVRMTLRNSRRVLPLSRRQPLWPTGLMPTRPLLIWQLRVKGEKNITWGAGVRQLEAHHLSNGAIDFLSRRVFFYPW